jgi:hypothetical protein
VNQAVLLTTIGTLRNPDTGMSKIYTRTDKDSETAKRRD